MSLTFLATAKACIIRLNVCAISIFIIEVDHSNTTQIFPKKPFFIADKEFHKS